MKEKIIALDLDGTLLNNESQLTDKTKEVIQRLSSKGHQVIITTGRPFRMAEEYYRQLKLETPMINFNGSLVHIPGQKWDHEHSRTIDKKYLLDMVAREEEIKADFIASEYRHKFFIRHRDKSLVNPELFGVEKLPKGSSFDSGKVKSNPNAILLQTHAEDKRVLAREMNDYYEGELSINTWGGPLNILEVSPKGVNKAYALRYLLNVLNREAKDLVAFGDEQNDKEMLALAGQGFAMKNCNPDLLPFADDQIQWTNQEDGVARVLEELYL